MYIVCAFFLFGLYFMMMAFLTFFLSYDKKISKNMFSLSILIFFGVIRAIWSSGRMVGGVGI